MFVLGYVIFKQKYKMIENGNVDGDIMFTCPKKMLNFPQKNYTQWNSFHWAGIHLNKQFIFE